VKEAIAVFVLLAVVAAVGSGQTLEVTSRPPVADGVVQEGEYGWSRSFESITLHLARSGDRLYAAAEAQTPGWVGIGIGSNRMSGAHIFIGFVRRGQAEISQHQGRGHRHQQIRQPVELQYGIREERGVTVMEISVPAEGFIRPGQNTLELILAFGRGDGFRGYHAYRRAVTVEL